MAVELDGALGRGAQSFLAHCRNQSLDFYVEGATWASASQTTGFSGSCAWSGRLLLSSPSSHGRPSPKLGHGIHLDTGSCGRVRIVDDCPDSLFLSLSLSPPPPPPSFRISRSLHFSGIPLYKLSNMILSMLLKKMKKKTRRTLLFPQAIFLNIYKYEHI